MRRSAAKESAPQPRKALDQGFATEAEAAKRFCPHQRIIWARLREDGGFTTVGQVSFNVAQIERSEERIPTATCLGSRCMSWRWSPNGEDGFCGLSGRPL